MSVSRIFEITAFITKNLILLNNIQTEQENNDSGSDSSLKNIISRHNLKARYWSYLFDNLNRAVDEIYCVCENDENINGCQVKV